MRCKRITMGNDSKRNDLLQKARDKRGWTQLELAEKLGAAANTVRHWESGHAPSLKLRNRLCALFGMTAEELGLVEESTEQLPQEEEQIVSLHVDQDPNRRSMLKR